MWSQLITVSTLTVILVAAEVSEGPSGINRVMSEGVRSVDYKLVYGDEDLTVLNEVINDVEKNSILKKNINLNDAIEPLPAQDIKCIMSVDRYCSKEMGEVKKILIQAIKDDCATCTKQDKEKAGKVVASMLTHDRVAWKLFLTRSTLLTKKREARKIVKGLKFKEVGDPEEVMRSPGNSYILSGVRVRVKRYVSELVE